MRREVIKKILLGAGAIIFDLKGLLGCAMISWKAALWYFGFAVIGAVFQYFYKDLEVELLIEEPPVPVESQPEAQPVEEVVLTETKVHTKPKKKPIKKGKKPIVKE